MLVLLRFIFIFLLFIPPVFAKIKDPLLFKISYGEKESLLFGSCHSISINELPHYAKTEILSAKTLVLEMLESFSDLSPKRLKELPITRKPGDPSWFDELGEPLQDYLVEAFEPIIKASHPQLTVKDLQYWVAFFKYHSPNHFGMDYQLQKNFFKSSEQFALEDMESAIKLVKKDLPELSVFIEILQRDSEYYLKTGDFYPALPNDDTEKSYREGDVKELKSNVSLLKNSAEARNRNWIPKIINYHSTKKRPLFVMGCYHLFGEQGVLKLLHDKGFKIDKINQKGEFSSIDLNQYVTSH